jgi:hypothetical protein
MNFFAKRPGLKVIRSSTRVGSLGVLTPIRGHVRIDKESVGPQLAEQPEPRTGSRCAFLYFQGQGFGKRNRVSDVSRGRVGWATSVTVASGPERRSALSHIYTPCPSRQLPIRAQCSASLIIPSQPQLECLEVKAEGGDGGTKRERAWLGMGRGRAPCCAKAGLNRGSWTPQEDMRLIAYIQKHGHANWRALPKQAGSHC